MSRNALQGLSQQGMSAVLCREPAHISETLLGLIHWNAKRKRARGGGLVLDNNDLEA
jgi:hypothetical protein